MDLLIVFSFCRGVGWPSQVLHVTDPTDRCPYMTLNIVNSSTLKFKIKIF